MHKNTGQIGMGGNPCLLFFTLSHFLKLVAITFECTEFCNVNNTILQYHVIDKPAIGDGKQPSCIVLPWQDEIGA